MKTADVQQIIREVALESLNRELLEAHQKSLPDGAMDSIAEAMVQSFFAGYAAAMVSTNKKFK